jgi:hypothetical protein
MKKFYILFAFIFLIKAGIASANTIPQVATGLAYNITSNSASIMLDIIYTGDLPITSFGVEIGKNTSYGSIIKQNSYTSDIGKLAVHVSNPASNLSSYADISCGNSYHFRAFATNDIGTAYGDDKIFNTLPCGSEVYVPTVPFTAIVKTLKAENITSNSALLSGELISIGEAKDLFVSISYFKQKNNHERGIGERSFPLVAFNSPGIFSSSTENYLECNTNYIFYAQATEIVDLKKGISNHTYGALVPFKTLPCLINNTTNQELISKNIPIIKNETIEDTTNKMGADINEPQKDFEKPKKDFQNWVKNLFKKFKFW